MACRAYRHWPPVCSWARAFGNGVAVRPRPSNVAPMTITARLTTAPMLKANLSAAATGRSRRPGSSTGDPDQHELPTGPAVARSARQGTPAVFVSMIRGLAHLICSLLQVGLVSWS